jgi:uncharacterized protein YbgA (DUF1722 family)
LTADLKTSSLAALYEAYGGSFMDALKVPATVKKHANVLDHLTGYFSERLSGAERRELTDLIRDYRAQLLPLIVPITLIHHYVRKYRVAYLTDQVYLAPSPKELMLRNHV